MAELAALLWDVDGTLAETEFDGHRPAFNAAFTELGVDWQWDEATYRRLLAVSGGRERICAWAREREGRPPAADLLEALLQRKRHHYGRLLLAGAVTLRPGVVRLIREAADAGLRQVIVTTSGRSAVADLCGGCLAELAGAFAFRICGEDVALKKPHPEAYRQALERLDLPAERALALEDSGNGLAAARGAGVTTLLTLSSLSRGEPAAAHAGAAAVVDSLEDPLPLHPHCGEAVGTLSCLQSLLPHR
jgi:HAD superfamily hydrolase (TIGR01509 family)